jgi:hypothetical protein
LETQQITASFAGSSGHANWRNRKRAEKEWIGDPFAALFPVFGLKPDFLDSSDRNQKK